jgi:hypothetical protein
VDRIHSRGSPARYQVLLPRPDRRCRVCCARDLLRNTRPLHRAANRCSRGGSALCHRLRRTKRSRTRDSRRPSRGSLRNTPRVRGGAGAAAVPRRLMHQLRFFLDTCSFCRCLRRNPRPPGRLPVFPPHIPRVATPLSIVLRCARVPAVGEYDGNGTVRGHLYQRTPSARLDRKPPSG